MKYTTVIAAICCMLLSCKKDAQQKSPSGAPAITSVSMFKAYSGSNQSAGFNVDLTADSTVVEKVDLYLSPALLRWTVNKPTTGHYVMYDHIGDYQQGAKYYFVFSLFSGDKVTSDIYTLP